MKKVLFALMFAAVAFIGCQKAVEEQAAPAPEQAPAATDTQTPATDQAPVQGQAQ